MFITFLNRRQIRWALLLSEYDFEIKYRSESLNFANESFRRSNYEDENENDDICLFTFQNKLRNIVVTSIAFSTESKKCEEISDEKLSEENSQNEVVALTQTMRRKEVVETCEKKDSYENSSQKLLNKIEELQLFDIECVKRRAFVRKNKKFKSWTLDSNNILRYWHAIYVFNEASLKVEILKRCHDDFLARHFEIEKIVDLIQRKFYWMYMRKNIEEYIKRCVISQRTKTHHHRLYDELSKLSVSTKSWKKIIIDMITEFSSSKWRKKVYDSIMMIVNRYIKMTIYVSIKFTMKANEMCDLLFDDVFLKYDSSKNIISNRESLFTSNFWSVLCYHAKIKRKLSIVFHSQTNDQTKRQNQILEHYLRCFCNHKQNNWVSLLLMTIFVYNCAKHASIELASFEALFEYVSDFNFKFDFAQSNILATRQRLQSLHDKREQLKKNLKHSSETQTKWINKKILAKTFSVRDKIMLSIKNLRQMRSKKKLSNKYIESFEIEDVVETQTYRLRLSFKWRIHSIFHVFLLEKYHINDFTESFEKVVLMNDHEKSKIEKILDVKEKMFRYLIRWKEYSSCDDEWIKEKNLNNVDETLATFKRKRVDIQLSLLVKKRERSSKRSSTKSDLRFRKENDDL